MRILLEVLFLLCDYIFLETLFFLIVLFPILVLTFLRTKATEEQSREEIWVNRFMWFTGKFRLVLLLVFLWLFLMLLGISLGKKIYQRNQYRFQGLLFVCFCFFLLILMIGCWYHTDLVFGAPSLLFWTYVVNTIVKMPSGDDDDDEDSNDEEEPPDTPTGDAVDLFLKSVRTKQSV